MSSTTSAKITTNGTKESVSYKPSSTAEMKNSEQLTDDTVQQRLDSLSKRIQQACDDAPKSDSTLKRELFVELELLRLDYIERHDIYALYMDYCKKLAGAKTDKAALDGLLNQHQTFSRIMTQFDSNRKLLYLKPKNYASNKLAETLRLAVLLTYSVGALIPLAIMLPLKFVIPKSNGLAFDDHLSKLFAHGFLFLCGVNVQYEGLDHMHVGSNIGMFNHNSNLDPVVIQSSPAPFKYIAKHSMKYVPLIGQVMWMLGHIFIDRKNLSQAKRALEMARVQLLKHGDSICISPEGTRSKTGRLQDFKKGPFHTAVAVNLPIQPMLMQGCFELWPSGGLMAKPGNVTIRFLPVVQPIPNEDYNQLANRVRRIMLQGSIQKSSDFKQSRRVFAHAVPLWAAWWVFAYYFVKLIRAKFAI